MPSYMTIVVIALAASNVSAALPVSVPVHSSREVREQSLSRRDTPADPHPTAPPLGYPSHGESETKPMLPEKDVPPPTKGGNAKQYFMQFVVGTVATMVGASILKAIAGAFSSSKHAAGPAASTSPPSSPANQNSQSDSYPPSYTSSSTSSGQYGQYGSGVGPGQYYQKQQRDVDHDKRADSFEAKARSIFDNNRRATSHLELLTRADLGEALKLFARVLDELD